MGWKRWFAWLSPKKKKVVPGVLGIPTPHTLMQKVADVREGQERQMLRLAEESIRRGHPEQAVIVYRKAAARYHAEGRPLKEAVVLQKISEHEPSDAQVLGRLVEIYEALERRIDAARNARRLSEVLAASGRVAESQLYSAKADVLEAHYGRPTPIPASSRPESLPAAPSAITPPPAVPPELKDGPLELDLNAPPDSGSDSGVALGRLKINKRSAPQPEEDEGQLEMPDVGRAAWEPPPAAPVSHDEDAFSLGGLSQVSEPVAPGPSVASVGPASLDPSVALSTPLPRRSSQVLGEQERPSDALISEPPIGGIPLQDEDDSIEDLNSLIDGQDPWEDESDVEEPAAAQDENNSTLFMPAVTKAALEADAQRSEGSSTVHLDGDEEATRAGVPKAITLALAPEDLVSGLVDAFVDEEEEDDDNAQTLFMSPVTPEQAAQAKQEVSLHMGAIQAADTDVGSSDEHEEFEEDDDDDGASTMFMQHVDEEMADRARADARKNKPPATNLRIPDASTQTDDDDD